MADQMRGLDMGCVGGNALTPTMDRLAQEGVLATRCYASTPVCSPSRASVLSGTHTMTHRVVANDLPLAADCATVGEVASHSGYQTAYVGKWHLDGVPRSKFTPPGPRRHGFDFWAVHNCTHQYFHPRYYRDIPVMIEGEGYEPTVQTDLMLEFLRALNEDDPFFAVLSWGPPHDPYEQVPQRYRDMYDAKALTLPPSIDSARLQQNPLLRGRDVATMTADYYAAVTALDAELSRLLAELDSLGREQDTIVCFTSDHGDMLGAHGLLNKQVPYEEAVRVPLILRWPGGLQGGARDEQLVSLVDLGPTLLGLAGLPSLETAEGSDLCASLGSGAPGAGSVFLANITCFDQAVPQGITEWRGVRTARHTYVETLGREPWLMFDNDADPWQMVNLVDDPGEQQTRQSLGALLEKWLERTGDSFETTEAVIDKVGMRQEWDLRQAGYD